MWTDVINGFQFLFPHLLGCSFNSAVLTLTLTFNWKRKNSFRDENYVTNSNYFLWYTKRGDCHGILYENIDILSGNRWREETNPSAEVCSSSWFKCKFLSLIFLPWKELERGITNQIFLLDCFSLVSLMWLVEKTCTILSISQIGNTVNLWTNKGNILQN